MTNREIINAVSRFYNLEEGDIFKTTRQKEVVFPRQVAMFLLREELKHSFPAIAKNFGNKDHTTAIYAYKKIAKMVKEDRTLEYQIDQIFASLGRRVIIPIKTARDCKKEIVKKKKIEEGDNYIEKEFRKMLCRQLNKQNSSYFISNLDICSLRKIDILEKYQKGFTLKEIGEVYNLTRERIRQLVFRELLFEACKMYRSGINLDINDFISKEKRKHHENVDKKHGIVKMVVVKKEKRWSRRYDYCRKCGTKTTKHKSMGYCKWCYPTTDHFKILQKKSYLKNIEKRHKCNKEYHKKYYKGSENINREGRQVSLIF